MSTPNRTVWRVESEAYSYASEAPTLAGARRKRRTLAAKVPYVKDWRLVQYRVTWEGIFGFPVYTPTGEVAS